MLPNKTARIVALVLAGLAFAPAFAGLASAQLPTPEGPDLEVVDVDVGARRVVNVAQPINITIQNKGLTNFDGATGWQIFVGLNGNQNADCIEPGQTPVGGGNQPTVASPCYIRMHPTSNQNADGTNSRSIRAGERRVYTLVWTAELGDVNDNARIWVEIMPYQSTTPGQDLENCQGPDPAPNCRNNRFVRSGVSIGRLGVRATAERQVSSSANADANTAWQFNEIVDPCPIASDGPVTRGCKAPAGKTIVAKFIVQNMGTVEDSYTPTYVGNQTIFRQYNVSFAPHNFTLGRAQQREVRVTLSIPESEPNGTQINVGVNTEWIQWTSQRSRDVHTNDPTGPGCSTTLPCVNPSLPSIIVSPRRGFNLTSNETWKQVFPDVTALFNITINNTGNEDDSFNLSFVNDTRTINDSWRAVIINPGVVPRKGFGNATIQITAPLNATNMTYTFEVLVKSRGDLDGTAPCKVNEIPAEGACKLKFTAHLAQRWSISGINDVPARVVPGEPVVYKLGIRNAGNGYDNVTLEMQSSFTGAAGGWDTRLSERVIRLTPFNTTPFTLTVTSPSGAQEGIEGSFFLNATSSGPIETPFELREKASIQSRMHILRGSNMRLDLPVNRSYVDAGGEASYDVVITNVGNVADNFTIPIPQRPSDWGVTVTPDSLELQPNQQGTVRVTLRAPSGATVGEKAIAIVKVLSTVERGREKQVTLEGLVSGPDFFVESVRANASDPYAGDPLEVSVVLGNSGNKGAEKNTTLRVVFVQDGVERLIGEKVYPPLFIGGGRRLVETFPWDTAGITGSGVLVARVDFNDTIPEIDDPVLGVNERSSALSLRTFSITITPARGIEARPGEKVTYGQAPNVFLVEYKGNQQSEPVTVRFESEHGWLTSQAEMTLALPQGTAIPFIATLDVPTLPGTARDTLSITVIPALRPEQAQRATTVTSILDEENPRVTRIVTMPASVTLGQAMNLEVHVEDATGVSSVVAYVTAPNNETSQVPLTQASPGRWNATRSWSFAGVHRVSAEAADAADPPNRNRTRDLVATFTVTPGSAPVVKLATGQPTTVRTGTPIKLDVRDPLGLGKASYAIRGVSFELRGPAYQIDTSTFQEGPVDITVTVENIYGVATTERFSFTVDNKPPGITRVTMTPDRPRANEDVTLVVQTEPKVEAVDVLVKRDGQVVQTLNATKKGIGSFSISFNPGEGDYRLDVTARDAAGNTKVSEGAVVFSAKPGSPFDVPGPGLLALVGALGVALALAARRRR